MTINLKSNEDIAEIYVCLKFYKSKYKITTVILVNQYLPQDLGNFECLHVFYKGISQKIVKRFALRIVINVITVKQDGWGK